jgi:squalene-associated FAD-dependent desaturase
MTKIAVIGAGWAGLAAAITLARQSPRHEIHLFEAGQRPGGRARALPSPSRLDNGQHLLSGAYGQCLALMRQIGIDPEARLRRLPLEIRTADGSFGLKLPHLPSPFHLLAGLFLARGVPISEKLAAFRWLARLRKNGFQPGPNPAAGPGGMPAADLPASRFLDDAGQHGALRGKLWNPLCRAALNTAPEHASARLFCKTLTDTVGAAREASDLLLPLCTLSELFPDDAARWLSRQGVQLHFSCRIKQVAQQASGWAIDGASFDAAILATAPQHLPALLPDPAFLPCYAYEPTGTLYFFYPPDVRLPCPLIELPEAWLIDRGGGTLATAFSGHGGWEALQPHALALQTHAQITQIPALAGQALPPFKLLIEKKAVIAAEPGGLRCPQETPWPGLSIAGDHVFSEYPATLEGAVRSGILAAERCLGS